MLHPPSTHFAVAIPLVALVIGFIYLYKPSELMSKFFTSAIVLAAIFVVTAYFTGKNDGSEVFQFLAPEGKELLKKHANLGLYLALSIGVVALVSLFGQFKNIFKVQAASIVLLLLVSGGILFQGKMGGELTYTYGAHVQDYAKGAECLKQAAEFAD